MVTDGVVPGEWLSGCIESHRRLESVVAKHVTDEVARQPSVLPGWTVGHVLTHLARNADAMTLVVESAGRGELSPMYPGGPAQREAGIEEGSRRSANELLADIESAQTTLEAAWKAASDEVWAHGLGMRRAGPETVSFFVFLRWRELQVHMADLGLGSIGDLWTSLPAAYLDREWLEMTGSLRARVPDDSTLVLVPGDRPSVAVGSGAEVIVVSDVAGRLLEWMMGRGGRESFPQLHPWSY